MHDALIGLTGVGNVGNPSVGGNTDNSENKYYYINGVHIGDDMAELSLSEVIDRLAVFTNN